MPPRRALGLSLNVEALTAAAAEAATAVASSAAAIQPSLPPSSMVQSAVFNVSAESQHSSAFLAVGNDGSPDESTGTVRSASPTGSSAWSFEPPPAEEDRTLRWSPEAAHRRRAVLGRPHAPALPENAASGTRFLATEASRPKAVNTNNFRLAVWTYSPKKKPSVAVANDAEGHASRSRPSTSQAQRMADRERPRAGVHPRPSSATSPNKQGLASFTSSSRVASSYLNSTLPVDLINIAFSYLPISDLAIASQVCRTWFVCTDPWAYVEQHGWVPLGPLTRATRVVLRVTDHDRFVAREILCCLKLSCARLTLELGSNVAAAAAAFPPIPPSAIAAEAETPALRRLTTLRLERPAPDDLRLLKERFMPRLPALGTVSIDRISLPVGAHEIVQLLRNSSVREVILGRVVNLTKGTLAALFRACPRLAVVTLEQCTLFVDRQQQQQLQQLQQSKHEDFSAVSSLTDLRLPRPPAIGDRSASRTTSCAVPLKVKLSGRVVADSSNASGYRLLFGSINGSGNDYRMKSKGGRAEDVDDRCVCARCLLEHCPCSEHEPPKAAPSGGLADRTTAPMAPAWHRQGHQPSRPGPRSGIGYPVDHRGATDAEAFFGPQHRRPARPPSQQPGMLLSSTTPAVATMSHVVVGTYSGGPSYPPPPQRRGPDPNVAERRHPASAPYHQHHAMAGAFAPPQLLSRTHQPLRAAATPPPPYAAALATGAVPSAPPLPPLLHTTAATAFAA